MSGITCENQHTFEEYASVPQHGKTRGEMWRQLHSAGMYMLSFHVARAVSQCHAIG